MRGGVSSAGLLESLKSHARGVSGLHGYVAHAFLGATGVDPLGSISGRGEVVVVGCTEEALARRHAPLARQRYVRYC